MLRTLMISVFLPASVLGMLCGLGYLGLYACIGVGSLIHDEFSEFLRDLAREHTLALLGISAGLFVVSLFVFGRMLRLARRR